MKTDRKFILSDSYDPSATWVFDTNLNFSTSRTSTDAESSFETELLRTHDLLCKFSDNRFRDENNYPPFSFSYRSEKGENITGDLKHIVHMVFFGEFTTGQEPNAHLKFRKLIDWEKWELEQIIITGPRHRRWDRIIHTIVEKHDFDTYYSFAQMIRKFCENMTKQNRY